MCIIILNKEGRLSEETLGRASTENPDGAGLMWAVNDRLFIYKNIKNAAVIGKYFEVRKTYPEIPIVLHFRIATDGLVNTQTCHPYTVNKDTALMHNGVLSYYSGRKTNESDTMHFIKENMAHLPSDVLWHNGTLSLIRQAIGYGNKFVLLRANGSYAILNEAAGHWGKKKKNWFSNSSYKPVEQRWTGDYTLASSWNENRVLKNTAFDWSKKCKMCGGMLFSKSEQESGYCYICVKEYSMEDNL